MPHTFKNAQTPTGSAGLVSLPQKQKIPNVFICGLITVRTVGNVAPFRPQGLALINGTQMITSLGCEALERASAIARQADIVAALTLEVLKGTTKAFDTGQQLLFGYAFNWGESVDIFRHGGGGCGHRGRPRRSRQP